jgi:hypothetical protein
MKFSNGKVLLAFACALTIGLVGPVLAKGKTVAYIEPKSEQNPAPAAAFNSFQRFEITPIAMDAPYAGQNVNEAAKSKMQANLDQDSAPLLAEWNAKPAAGAVKTLRIEPSIRHIKIVGTGARIFGGGMAGGSAVLVTVKISDAQTGEVLAEPEFYQHANRIAGAYSFGAADQAILGRVAAMITEYLRTNYAAPVGGPTSISPSAAAAAAKGAASP